MSSVSCRTSSRRSFRVSGVPASVSSSVTALKTWSESSPGSCRKSSGPSFAMHAWWTRDFSSAYGSPASSAVASAAAGASPVLTRRSWRPTALPPRQRQLAPLAVLRRGGAGRRGELLRDRVHGLRELAAGLREDGRVAPVHRQRDGLVARKLVGDLHPERLLDLAELEPDVRVRPVHDVAHPAGREREQLEGLHRELHVLQRRDVHPAEDEQLVGA